MATTTRKRIRRRHAVRRLRLPLPQVDLGNIKLIARTEHDAVGTGIGGEKDVVFMNVKALNEWD